MQIIVARRCNLPGAGLLRSHYFVSRRAATTPCRSPTSLYDRLALARVLSCAECSPIARIHE
jgi:hypothetical protein